MGDDLDPDVREFILACGSVVRLEVLLLLRQAGDEWTALRAATELRIDATAAAEQLEELCAHGLLQGGPAYRYQPADASLAALVDRVAAAYTDRRVSVISLVYSQPGSAVRRFSAAFRLRRTDDDG
jgi:predicted ArsR family transcriptional regulator